MSIKKLSVLLTFLFFSLPVFTLPVFAQKIVVVTEELPPYNYTDESDQLTGISTEIIREVFKRAQLNYSIESLPWARAYRIAQDQPNVAIYSMGRSEEREAKFKWVGELVKREIWLYKLRSRSDIKLTKLTDLRNYVVGGIREGIRTQYLVKEGFEVEQVTDDVSNIKKLHLNRIDLFPIDELGLAYLAAKTGVDFETMERAFRLDKLSGALNMAFSLQTSDEVVEKCRAALESMKKDGSFNKIQAKWLKKK